MRLLFLLLFAPLVAVSQSLTGFDFTCKTMEILDPVKYSDEYYVIEETRPVDLKVSFYHNNIVIYDHVTHVAHELRVHFIEYNKDMNADVYSYINASLSDNRIYVFYDEGMLNICIEYIPEWDRYKNIYRLRNLTYIKF